VIFINNTARARDAIPVVEREGAEFNAIVGRGV
jgi:hypothetical protein